MADLDPAPVLDAMARDPQLRVFLGHGRIETLPAKQPRRRLMLDQIAQAFEPGVRYPERSVSLFLGRRMRQRLAPPARPERGVR